MNSVYFSCPLCRVYVDAGYRHAYWQLEEPSIINRTEVVDADAVLGAREYWNVDAAWLLELLPAVRRFLEEHRGHGLRYGDDDEVGLPLGNSEEQLDWLMEAGFVLCELPRYYIERLGFRTWDQVIAHVDQSKTPPRWWEDEELRQAASERFARYVRSRPTAR